LFFHKIDTVLDYLIQLRWCLMKYLLSNLTQTLFLFPISIAKPETLTKHNKTQHKHNINRSFELPSPKNGFNRPSNTD
jgi:hypothetical protein